MPVVCRLGFPYSAASVDLTLSSGLTRAGPFRRELDELQLDDHELGSLQSFGSASAHSDSDKVSHRLAGGAGVPGWERYSHTDLLEALRRVPCRHKTWQGYWRHIELC